MQQDGFKAGLKSGSMIAIGYFPIALTFGLLAKTTGLSIIEAVGMSIFVFAGASQYIALSLIAGKVDPLVIVLNTFIVNIRHFLMTASLNEKMQPETRWKKAVYAFGVTDETFSVISTHGEGRVRTSYAAGVIIMAYGSWVIFTGVGHVIGANLPLFLQAAMSIALYAMFVALLVPSMKGNRKVVMLALTAAALNGFFFWTGLLSTGWAIMVSTLASAIFVEIIYSRRGAVIRRAAGGREGA
ncbi:AzlC family ABC transporter permease [Edaphobacillus lindanitolerans]|uniref:4-azaleucine resistance probable transporter AzlC n=1 Tax=Edaphobacillus lindanitolerans TaxID=550447 RepID=A0A1U7PJJ8_9BACI|nr:AzlC family ABC transporter permease [Edaphobacillus lindanitolerans]SIT69026.1 4-azaleucine resistance probable transporter AzlC [Edaphobacillus lindanitolerans]